MEEQSKRWRRERDARWTQPQCKSETIITAGSGRVQAGGCGCWSGDGCAHLSVRMRDCGPRAGVRVMKRVVVVQWVVSLGWSGGGRG